MQGLQEPESIDTSPGLYLARLWFLDSDNLITVEQTHGIEGLFQLEVAGQYEWHRRGKEEQAHPSHSINGRLSNFMVQIVSLDETDAMFSGDGTLHLDGALHHSVDDIFGDLSLRFVEEDDRFQVLADETC